MSAKVKDYNEKIQELKEQARNEGKETLELCAKDLHNMVSKSVPTLPTCCIAMRQNLLQGDSIIVDTSNKSGASMSYTVQYYLNDNEREPLFPPKKRGRKKGEKYQKVEKDNKEEKAETIFLTEKKILQYLDSWITSHDITYSVDRMNKLMYLDGKYGLWVIDISRVFDSGLHTFRAFESLAYGLPEIYDKCSMLYFDDLGSHCVWELVSPSIKRRLNLTALFIDQDGNITECQ